MPIESLDNGAKYVIGLHGPPAFVRRGRNVEAAWEALLARCRAERAEMLKGVRWNLKPVADALKLQLDEDAEVALQQFRDAISKSAPARWHGPMIESCGFLMESIERFNARWEVYVAALDLSSVNSEIEKYNEHYVVEKESFVGSEQIARQGFEPMRLITTADVANEFRPLQPLYPIQKFQKFRYAIMASFLFTPFPIIWLMWGVITIRSDNVWFVNSFAWFSAILIACLAFVIYQLRQISRRIADLEARAQVELDELPPNQPVRFRLRFGLFGWMFVPVFAWTQLASPLNADDKTTMILKLVSNLCLIAIGVYCSFRVRRLIDRQIQLELTLGQSAHT